MFCFVLFSNSTTSFSPNSLLLGVLNVFLRCPTWCVHLPDGLDSLCTPSWIECPEGFDSPCTPSLMVCSPFRRFLFTLYPLFDGASTFPRIVPLLVSLCWMGCLFSRGSCLPFVSPCTPSRCPLLSAFPRLVFFCLPMCPFWFPFAGRCVRLLEGLVSLWFPLYPFFLSQFVGWCVRLPEVLVPPCVPLYPFSLPFVRWCVRLPKAFSPYLPCCPFLDGVSAFPRMSSPLWLRNANCQGISMHS